MARNREKLSLLGLKIAYYRKLNGLTQEELAEKMGVSCQAVSKWEQQISCPDIMHLPELAKIFNVKIDELFGNSSEKEIIYSLIGNVPWNDDRKLRVAFYNGRKLMEQSTYTCIEGVNLINIQFSGHGDQYNVNGVCKINCSKRDNE